MMTKNRFTMWLAVPAALVLSSAQAFALDVTVPSPYARRSESCVQLITYRDQQLVRDWSQAVTRYRVSAEVRKDLLKERDALMSESLWHASDVGFFKDMLVAHLNTTITLIANLLKLNPQTGAPLVVGSAVQITSQRVLKALDAGQTIQGAIVDGLIETGAKEAASASGPVGQGIRTLYELAQGARLIAEMPADHAELRKTINEQLVAIDRALNDYDAAMVRAQQRVAEVNAVREAVDVLCNQLWTGSSGGASVPFGQTGGCQYAVHISDVRLQMRVVPGVRVADARMSATMTETTPACATPVVPQNGHYFRAASGALQGPSVVIALAGEATNAPASQARFDGTIVGTQMRGTVRIWRTDIVAPWNWSVSIPVTLTLAPH